MNRGARRRRKPQQSVAKRQRVKPRPDVTAEAGEEEEAEEPVAAVAAAPTTNTSHNATLPEQGRAILDLIVDATRDQDIVLPTPEQFGVTAAGIEAVCRPRGTLKHLLKFIKAIDNTANIELPPAASDESDWDDSDVDLEFSLLGGGVEQQGVAEQEALPSQATVTFDPLDPRGLRVHTRCGQLVPIARGFEFFPFGRTGYRHSTVGQCLLEALLEVRHSDLFRDSALPTDQAAAAGLTDKQILTIKEQGLRKILTVFDNVVFNELPRYMTTIGWSPHRKLRMKANVQTYKMIDDNMLAYCSNARLLEKGTTRSAGFSVLSQSLKFIGMAVNVYQHPQSTAMLGPPSRLDTALKLRRARRFRNLKMTAPPSSKSWVKPRMTHAELTRTLGGE